MTKIKILKNETLERLRGSIPENLSLYRAGAFSSLEADPSVTREIDIDFDEEKLKSIKVPKGDELYDIENCIIIGESLINVTPYLARDERLWAYLTHTILLGYSRARWNIPEDDEEAVKYIRSHFFAKDKRQIERDNAASRLWWLSHLCKRVDDLDVRTTLEIFLYRSDVRANIVERPTTSQSVAVFSALLSKLTESYKGAKSLFERDTFRKFIKEVNSVGGAKLLDCLNQSQVENVLEEIIDKRLKLESI